MDNNMIRYSKTSDQKYAEQEEAVRNNLLYQRVRYWYQTWIPRDSRPCLNCKSYPRYRIAYNKIVCTNCFCYELFTPKCLRFSISTILKYIRNTSHLLLRDDDMLRVAPRIVTDSCIWAMLLYWIKINYS